MKQNILDSLTNKQIAANDNRQLLADTLDDNIPFEPFNDQIYAIFRPEHQWDTAYFDEQAMDLKYNFSKERCMHVIDVKEKMQNRGEKGFSVVQTGNIPLKTNHAETSDMAIKQSDLSDFKPEQELLSYLNNGTLLLVRTKLETYLNDMNLSLQQVVQSVYYVYQQKPEVFEEHKVYSVAKDIELADKSIWDWEYFNLQQVYLSRNFSLTRLLHLVNVREELAIKGLKEFQNY